MCDRSGGDGELRILIYEILHPQTKEYSHGEDSLKDSSAAVTHACPNSNLDACIPVDS